jgi:hypothetical protein
MNAPEFVHLNDVKQDHGDFYADIWLRRVQIDDQQTVSFRHPEGPDSQLKLARDIREGTILRVAEEGVDGRGFLVLHVRLMDF